MRRTHTHMTRIREKSQKEEEYRAPIHTHIKMSKKNVYKFATL